MSVLIAAHNLNSGYHGTPAVHDLDLQVEAGQVVLLAGPNGAGKTTTVMTLAGAIRPISGTVEMDGKPTASNMFRRVRAGLGVVTERRSVFGQLTVLDNLRLGRGSVELALEHFPELDKRLHVRAGLLSGGEQQMLSLARVLAAKPRIILADEMSLGLAPIVVNRLLRALRLAADEGTGVLLVEQHLHVALDICDEAQTSLDSGGIGALGWVFVDPEGCKMCLNIIGSGDGNRVGNPGHAGGHASADGFVS